MSDFLGEVKRRADKEMMHLTRSGSIADEVRQWSYGKVHSHIAELLRLFVDVQCDPAAPGLQILDEG
jgi:hypothetical protein